MRTICPDCKAKTEKIGAPTRSGHFLDQLYDCLGCDWCGVETVLLTKMKMEEMKRKEKEPEQLRLFQ